MAVRREHEHLPQSPVTRHHLRRALHERDEPFPRVRLTVSMLGQLDEHVDTLLEQCVRQRRLFGAGVGLSLPPAMNTGTFGVAPYDAGVASATLNVGQQLGGSIGTALLNTIATSATASYLASLHLSPAALASAGGRLALAAAAVHGFTTAF